MHLQRPFVVELVQSNGYSEDEIESLELKNIGIVTVSPICFVSLPLIALDLSFNAISNLEVSFHSILFMLCIFSSWHP